MRRILIGATVSLVTVAAMPARAQSMQDLSALSIDELANLNVSSVSKSSEALRDAPAAIFVITHDDIVRSGATTIPEILRLAPNLYVAQMSASQYTITARGLSGNQQAQNFTNKLLVLIDGRSVYTPLYSGVYWDMQDVLPDDIERIEVVSGPGATLWGANAVNGVINIITRRSDQTQGLLATADGGARERNGGLRYGTKLGADVTARAYVRGIEIDQSRTAAGIAANDDWWRVQGGFRLDWAASNKDALTFQGDLMNSRTDHLGAGDELTQNRNLLARWTRTETEGGALEVQAYFDRSKRETRQDGGEFSIDTYDLYFQHNSAPGARNDFVWGGGIRASRFNINGNNSIFFEPPRRTLLLGNVFAQYGLALAKRLKLTIGIKAEDDPYVGTSILPNVRLAWKPTDTFLLWSAVSRAVRSPTPFDRDVVEVLGGQRFLIGDPDFRTEKLTAFEAGTRIQAGAQASLSISAYYNIYDDLRSIEPAPGGFIPIRWGNGLKGRNYGLEAWGDLAVTRWWKLGAGLNLLHDKFRFQQGSSGLLGVSQLGDDPPRQATLRSSMSLGRGITIDADLRYVGPLPDPAVPSYTEMGGRIGWRLSERLQLSVSAMNLLHKWHQELPPQTANQVPRKILAGLKWRM
ncbi:TonB-dependent receptor plug domain-containing protein [Sphingomonas crusticola]|uniref:TonB-dependent receptor plug domain-containing protein n=1 Tax=Sphingomonas crusticola TaxID=1697973 RepID=UPI000E23A465|nr:TonB-dependent receptor [Sphingomonas crusticola]